MSYIHRYEDTYNADSEEPNCLRCDHARDKYERFCSKCGPEYWWHNYIRTEFHEIEITDEEEKRLRAIIADRLQKKKQNRS